MVLFFAVPQTLPFLELMKRRLQGSGDIVAAAVDLLLVRVRALRERVMAGEVDIQVGRLDRGGGGYGILGVEGMDREAACKCRSSDCR